MLSLYKLLKPLNSNSKVLKLPIIGPLSQLSNGIHSLPKFITPSDEMKKAFKNLPDLKEAPTPALLLGTSGLIPFASIPIYMLQSGAYIPELAYASLTYSAVILSFLGGVRWGSAIPSIDGVNHSLFTSWPLYFNIIMYFRQVYWNPIGKILDGQ